MMENNCIFMKKYISKHRALSIAKEGFLVISKYCKKRRILIYLTKAVLKRMSNAI